MAKARYEIRVCQGNYIARQVKVEVIAGNSAEARRKAIALVNVHSPVVVIDKVTEIPARAES